MNSPPKNLPERCVPPARVFQKTVTEKDSPVLCDALALLSGLSKTRIKNALAKGAVWVRRSRGKKERIRRITAKVHPGDGIWLYYDPDILERAPPKAECLKDLVLYSIWYKPPGLMSQGSPFGDHCALPRQIEASFSPKRPVFLLHRLDREVGGVIIVAHGKIAAARLSEMLRENRIEKRYQARLKGDVQPPKGEIDLPLDGKPARTSYEVIAYDALQDVTTVHVAIRTGRLHQIRRHFDLIGYPVMGDPRYGEGNRFDGGLQLTAYALSFDCPFGKGRIDVAVEP